MDLKGKKLGFYYKEEQWLFRDFSLIVSPGEVVGLFGRSGQGKTTLAKVLGGYEKAIEGEVLLNNESIHPRKYNPIQLIHQHPELTMNPRWKMKKVIHEGGDVSAELIAELGIQEHLLERYPNEISGGEQQRCAIARVLNPKTKYLIADEITTMLDAITQVEIWTTILSIVRKQNVGLLIISHDLVLLSQIADRVIELPM